MNPILFLFSPLVLIAGVDQSDIHYQPEVAPLMAFDEENPLFINQQNASRLAFQASDREALVHALEQHVFPLYSSLFLLALVFGSIQAYKKWKMHLQYTFNKKNAEDLLREKENHIQSLIQSGKRREAYQMIVDGWVETIARQTGQQINFESLHALKRSVQEFDGKLEGMGEIVETAFYVKFAGIEPSEEECKKVILLAKIPPHSL